MIKIICNRCGNGVQKSDEDSENELTFTGKQNTRYGIDERMNLCDDCLEGFRVFMDRLK